MEESILMLGGVPLTMEQLPKLLATIFMLVLRFV
jgi:hypothetical protein